MIYVLLLVSRRGCAGPCYEVRRLYCSSCTFVLFMSSRILNYSMKQILYYFHFDGNYYAGDHIDIHNNQSVNIYEGQQSSTSAPRTSETVVEDITPVDSSADVSETDIAWFKYIHVAVTDDKERARIHKMVCNIVQLPRMKQICDELYLLMKEEKVLTSIKPEAMLAELRRIGMPSADTPGFSDQNFYSNYRA